MTDPLVLDTTVLIDYRRRNYDAREFVLPLISRNVATIHPVTIAELVDGVRHRRDLDDMMKFLGGYRRLAVKSSDFDRCLAIQAEMRLSHGMGWPDCLIAATCLRLGLPLVTLNDKHFRPIRGLSLIRPN